MEDIKANKICNRFVVVCIAVKRFLVQMLGTESLPRAIQVTQKPVKNRIFFRALFLKQNSIVNSWNSNDVFLQLKLNQTRVP